MLRNNLLFVLWMVFMTVMLLMPSDSVPKVLQTMQDWLIHMSIMLISVCLLYFPYRKSILSIRFYLYTVIFFMLYSAVIEYCQEVFIPGRGGTFADVAANMTGVLIALVLIYLHNKSLNKQ